MRPFTLKELTYPVLICIGLGLTPNLGMTAENVGADRRAAAKAKERFNYYSDRISEIRRTYAIEKADAVGDLRFHIDLFDDVMDSIGNFNYEERYRTAGGVRIPVQARIIPERTAWQAAANTLSNLLLEIGAIADVGPWGPALDALGLLKGEVDEALMDSENPWRSKKEVEADKRELIGLLDQAENRYLEAYKQAYCDSGLAALDVQVWNLRRCEIPNDLGLQGDRHRSDYRSTLTASIDRWRSMLSNTTKRGLPRTRSIPRVVTRVCKIKVAECPRAGNRRPGIQP